MHELLRIYAVVSFERIHPDRTPLSAIEAAAAFGPVDRAPPERPYIGLNMVATADGKATIDGRSGPIGNEADRELFHELRGCADAVMAGAGTVRAERYGRLVRDPERRERRRAGGLDPDPLAVIVSGRLDLPLDLPLLQAPEQRVVIVTASDRVLPDLPAAVHYIRGSATGSFVELAPAMRELRDRFGVRSVLCEGGPLLNSELLRDDLVDELWLAVAPKLAGGAAPTIVTGGALDPPVELTLEWVLESGDDHLFLRYRVRR
jgi:riboflavin-specific deaminase-like protein